jgi:hypothetical protein
MKCGIVSSRRTCFDLRVLVVCSSEPGAPALCMYEVDLWSPDGWLGGCHAATPVHISASPFRIEVWLISP